jgi:hypothetical protein
MPSLGIVPLILILGKMPLALILGILPELNPNSDLESSHILKAPTTT